MFKSCLLLCCLKWKRKYLVNYSYCILLLIASFFECYIIVIMMLCLNLEYSFIIDIKHNTIFFLFHPHSTSLSYLVQVEGRSMAGLSVQIKRSRHISSLLNIHRTFTNFESKGSTGMCHVWRHKNTSIIHFFFRGFLSHTFYNPSFKTFLNDVTHDTFRHFKERCKV